MCFSFRNTTVDTPPGTRGYLGCEKRWQLFKEWEAESAAQVPGVCEPEEKPCPCDAIQLEERCSVGGEGWAPLQSKNNQACMAGLGILHR